MFALARFLADGSNLRDVPTRDDGGHNGS